MKTFETIMVTTDFSEISQLALRWAYDLADRFGSKLILAHVHEQWAPLAVEESQPYFHQMLEQQRKQVDERLAALAMALGKDVQPMTAVGIPHHEIVRMAQERAVDLIVMATHGRGFVAHALLGSTTERVLRSAPCPVLAVRDPGSDRDQRPAREVARSAGRIDA